VRAIYNHFKNHGIRTEVMGASFRNLGQVIALAGCDLLTISPELLTQLSQSDAPLTRQLSPELARQSPSDDVRYGEAAFRYALNDDAMATEKLAEGIRAFAADAVKLEGLIRQV
jgi:transaldolase